MPVPGFTIDGVLPPFVGPNGPGGALSDMSPYQVLCVEVVGTLGDTRQRRSILRGWLEHRRQLRLTGVINGYQWLDGSFVENKIPNDLDIVTFFHRPPPYSDSIALTTFLAANARLFRRPMVKPLFNLDAFFVDLNGPPERVVDYTRYLLGLFSHRRNDSLWKGMLQVRLEDDADDASAMAEIERLDAVDQAGVAP